MILQFVNFIVGRLAENPSHKDQNMGTLPLGKDPQ